MGLKSLSYSKCLALPTYHLAELDGLRSRKADLVSSLGLGLNPSAGLYYRLQRDCLLVSASFFQNSGIAIPELGKGWPSPSLGDEVGRDKVLLLKDLIEEIV